MKKRGLILLLMLLCLFAVPASAKTNGPKVSKRTEAQIRNYIKKHPINTTKDAAYKKKPKLTAPYSAGELKAASLKAGLSMVNTVRYIAGLSSNVKTASNYNKEAQAAALVCALNGELNHEPTTKPSGMSDSLFNLGKSGCGSSNLGQNKSNLAAEVLDDWIKDWGPQYQSIMAHRRWLLNPSLKKIGFGLVKTSSSSFPYSAVKVEDDADPFAASKQTGVVWPAQVMPLGYFESGDAWTVSTGEDVDISKIKVTLTRKRGNKKWTFSKKSSKGKLYVDNTKYGNLTGCVIFIPKSLGAIKAGDKFTVKITGLKSGTFQYTVKFFQL